MRFRPDIEGLRAVAILGVIFFHAGVRAVPGGYLGVDVFFVLSGFLITGILIEEVQRTGTISLPAFWARRARRLLPAATLMSLVTLLLAANLDSLFALKRHAMSALSFASYWSNLLFMGRNADYFNQGLSVDPFLHTWTLAVEEQYYLVFAPLVLLLALSAGRADYRAFRRHLLIGAVAVIVACLIAFLLLNGKRPLIAFYALPARAWEFAFGSALAVTVPRTSQERSAARTLLALIGLAAVVTPWLIAGTGSGDRGALTLVTVLGTSGLLYLGSQGPLPSLVGRLLESPFMGWIGRLSYSWYLWHWPLTVYWTKLFGGSVPLALGMPLLSLALAQATFVMLEAPVRRAPLFQVARRGLVMALLLAAVTGSAALALWLGARRQLRDPALAFIVEARELRPRMNVDGCQATIAEVSPRLCGYGAAASDTTVVLFGDSHAARWFPALERLSTVRPWRIVPLTKGGCPSVSLTVWRAAIGRAYWECDRWRDSALARIRTMHPAIVIISNSFWYDVSELEFGQVADVTPAPTPLWERGLRLTLERLPETSVILLMQDVPYPRFDVPSCLAQHRQEVSRCAFDRDSAVAGNVSRVEREVAVRDWRVTYGDPVDRICNGPVCLAARGDTALFSDTQHLAVGFAASLSNWLGTMLDSALASARARAPTPPATTYLPHHDQDE